MATSGGYAEATSRNLGPEDTTLELQTKLGLEFQISDLNQRVDLDQLIRELHSQLLKVVIEDDTLGIEFKPSKRFPQKCIIIFANEMAKNKVQVRGLSVFKKTVTLTNPGQGLVKVEISNASMLIPNDIIKNWLAGKVGGMENIVQFRNDHYYINGQKRKWVSGTRFAYIKNLTSPLPPADKFKYGSKDVNVNIWHYGQTHMKCRFCYQIVPKGHECARRQQRQGCHKCGSLAHLQRECPEQSEKRKCYRCGSEGHLQKDCTIQVKADGMGGQRTKVQGKAPEGIQNSSFQRGGEYIIPNLIDQALLKKKTDDEAKKKKAEEAEKKRKLREQQNQEAIDERERQYQAAMEENKKMNDERMEKATTAAAAADRRLSSALSSAEESLTSGVLKLETSSSSMEVDQPSDVESEIAEESDDEGDDTDDEGDDEESEQDTGDENSASAVEKEEHKHTDDETTKQDAAAVSTDDDDENNLDTTKFQETFEKAMSFHHQAAQVAIVGGSNVPNIKLVSDEDLHVQSLALWEGGAEIIQGAEKISEASKEVRESFDTVVIHLGTCNFPCKGESSVMSHFKDYMEMVKTVRDLCPNAHIVMSGLLPQAGEGRSLANEQISGFNAALKAVGDDESESHLHFCDNWSCFVKDGKVLDGLFKDPDTYGVHVNDLGSIELSASIMQKVKQVFYWERLGVPLSPSH